MRIIHGSQCFIVLHNDLYRDLVWCFLNSLLHKWLLPVQLLIRLDGLQPWEGEDGERALE